MYVRVSCPVWCIVNDNNNLHILFVSPIEIVYRNTILKCAVLPFQALHFQIMAIQAKKLSAAHFTNIPNISQNRHTEQSLHRKKTSSYPGQMHEIFVIKLFAHWQGGSSAPKSLEVCTRLKDNIQTLYLPDAAKRTDMEKYVEWYVSKPLPWTWIKGNHNSKHMVAFPVK